MLATAEQLELVLRGGRYSFGFVLDIAVLEVKQIASAFSILDAVARFEGDLSRNASLKPPTRYKRMELRGLWHGHFFCARFVMANLRNENSEKRIREAMRPFFGMEMDEVVAAQLAHAMTVGAFENRAKRRAMTGECVVFEAKGTGNHYLTIRRHKEDDAMVARRIAEYRAIDEAIHQQGQIEA